jgi:drug/metabolite transporter (DMT)-like permease
MNYAIICGIASAVFYGTTDFVSHFANKASGVLRTMLYGQLLLASLLSLWLVAESRIPAASITRWAILIASDFCILAATGCLYRALAVGNLSVVPPVTACYGAVAAALSIATGEKVSPVALSGLILAIFGGVAAAAPARAKQLKNDRQPSGLILASAAAIFYGAGFWTQGKYSVPTLGKLVPIWSYYVVGSLTLLALAGLTRSAARPPTLGEAPALFGTAVLAVAGYGALVLGQASGHVAVVTALSAAASAVTVVLAHVFLKQPVARFQWIGLCAVICGLALLHRV